MIIATFRSPEYAYLAKSYLASLEITSVISDEHICQWSWHLTDAFGGVKLHVREEDVESARKYLRQAAYIEVDGKYELLSVPRYRALIFVIYLLTGGSVMPIFFGRETIRVKTGKHRFLTRNPQTDS